MPILAFDTVLVNGSVGTGKTTTAEALGAELEQRGIPGAVIDVDWLRRSWPSPPGDPFRTTLALANMQAIAANFRRAGAQVLVVASVVETRDELQRSAVALSANCLLHVRLSAAPGVVQSRLTERHRDDAAALDWHTRRHPVLARMLDRAGFTDELALDTSHATVDDVVQTIVAAVVPESLS